MGSAFEELIAEAAAEKMLDVQSGDGRLLQDLPRLPPLLVATGGYAPNVMLAGRRLLPRGASGHRRCALGETHARGGAPRDPAFRRCIAVTGIVARQDRRFLDVVDLSWRLRRAGLSPGNLP
jgi:hypothetical protein